MKQIFQRILALLVDQKRSERPPIDYETNIRRQLLNKNIIDLWGSIDGHMAEFVRSCISELAGRGNPDIEVWITSDGGLVDMGLYIYDMLRLYPGKKTGRVISFSDSIAPVILQACDTRSASRHARIQIHNISRPDVSLDTLRDTVKLQRLIEKAEEEQQKLYRILCERTGQPEQVIRDLCAEDRTMTATEAQEKNLIDLVV